MRPGRHPTKQPRTRHSCGRLRSVRCEALVEARPPGSACPGLVPCYERAELSRAACEFTHACRYSCPPSIEWVGQVGKVCCTRRRVKVAVY